MLLNLLRSGIGSFVGDVTVFKSVVSREYSKIEHKGEIVFAYGTFCQVGILIVYHFTAAVNIREPPKRGVS